MTDFVKRNKNKTIEFISMDNKVYKIIFYSIIITLFSISFLYAYFLNKTVRNIAEMGRIENEIVDLNSRIGNLENKLISSDTDITIEEAKRLGFIETKEGSKYISLMEEPNSLTLYVKRQ